MSKSTGLGTYLYVDGNDLSGDTNSISSISGGPAAIDMTGIDKSAFERQGGKREGKFGWMSYFNPASGKAHPILSALPRVDINAMAIFTQTLGAPGAAIVAKQVDYAGNRDNAGGFLLTVEALGNGFGIEWGIQHTAGPRTDTASTNGTGVDGAAATTFGLQMYVQLLSLTGTSILVKLQESSDNGGSDAFADVVGATTAALTTAPQVARVATANNLSVERYLRVATTGVSLTSATFLVLVARNQTLTSF